MSNPHITWMFNGSTEASTIGLPLGSFPETLQVPLPTGRVVTFRRNGAVRNGNGEVTGMDYRYVDESPEGSDASLTVYND